VIENTVSDSVIPADDPYADYQIPDDLVWWVKFSKQSIVVMKINTTR
jgi:hypothetical protein